MSESDTEQAGIRDEDLPEDLQPGEDNPLAESPDPDEVDRDQLDLLGGKSPEQSEDDPDDGDGDDADR